MAAPREGLKTEHVGVGPSGHAPLNVLVWGQDSISRLMFMRKLPLTWNYLQSQLKAIVLQGYNIVGDGTPQVTDASVLRLALK